MLVRVWLLAALIVACCEGSDTLLTYGPPFQQSPEGFSLFDTSTDSFVSVPEAVALLAPGRVEGVLACPTHLVLFGGFNWLVTPSQHQAATNIAVMTWATGEWAALTPSVFGHAVYDATWEFVGKTFFVVGQLRGLDTSPGYPLMGVAHCTIGGSCRNVGDSLNNVPVFAAQVAWNAAQGVLTVVWSAEQRSLFVAAWTVEDGWFYRDMPPLLTRLPAGFYYSFAGRFVLSFSENGLMLESWLCKPTPARALGVYVTEANQPLDGCWEQVDSSALDIDQLTSAVASASGVLFIGAVNVNLSVSMFKYDTEAHDITYNFGDFGLPFKGLFFSRPQMYVFEETPVFTVQSTRDNSTCPGALFVLHGTRWYRKPLPLCLDSPNTPVLDFAAIGSETLLWHCGTQNVTIWSLNIDASDQDDGPNVFRALTNIAGVYRAGRIQSFCEAGQSLWIKGQYGALGLPPSEIGETKQILPTEDGSVLWMLGSRNVKALSLPLYCRDCPQPLAACKTNQALQSMWIVYSHLYENNVGVSVAAYDFSGLGSPENAWRFWHPQFPKDVVSDQLVADLTLFQSGPAVIGDFLYMPFSFSFPNRTIGSALFRFDTQSRTANASQWEPVLFFIQTSSFPYWVSTPQFSGVQIDEVNQSLWIYGTFVFSNGAVNKTDYVNIVRVDLKSSQLLPIESMAPPSQTQSAIYTGDLGWDSSLWVGGTMSTLPEFSVLNVAGMNTRTGQWGGSTVQFGSPPAFATVSHIAFNAERTRMAVVSRDPTPEYHFGGMNVFSLSSVFPDPSVALWVYNVDRVLPLSMTVSAPSWQIVLVLGLSVFLIGTLSALIILIWRLGARKSFRYIEIPNYMDHGVKTNIQAILQDSDVMKLPAGTVELAGLIGQGGQGIVRRARYDGQDVAAKAVVDFSQEVFSSFLKEIKMLASISHPNIVTFLGIYFDSDTLYLITELMDTDLSGILSQLDNRMKIQVTIDIASAVSFLHSFRPPVLHRDLKPGNILISRDGRIKLADFGVSRLLMDSQTQKAQMTRDAGTLLYMAPEVFTSNTGYDTSADVYSYALVVLEVFTGEPPFSMVGFRFMLDFVDRVVSRKISPDVARLPLSCPDVIREIVRAAASFDARDRPSAAEISKRLNSAFKGMSAASLPVQKHMRGSGGLGSSSSSHSPLPSIKKVRSVDPPPSPASVATLPPVSKGKEELE